MKNILNYNLRKVKEDDCDLIFEWANDEAVRKNSFSSNTIRHEDHIKWFNEKLKSNDSIIYIFEANDEKVGLIRLDKLDTNSFLINYSIDKEHRGKGYATFLLKLIKDKYKSSLLIGKVKLMNIASIKAFIKADYIMKEELDINIFYSFNRKQL